VVFVDAFDGASQASDVVRDDEEGSPVQLLLLLQLMLLLLMLLMVRVKVERLLLLLPLRFVFLMLMRVIDRFSGLDLHGIDIHVQRVRVFALSPLFLLVLRLSAPSLLLLFFFFSS